MFLEKIRNKYASLRNIKVLRGNYQTNSSETLLPLMVATEFPSARHFKIHVKIKLFSTPMQPRLAFKGVT